MGRERNRRSFWEGAGVAAALALLLALCWLGVGGVAEGGSPGASAGSGAGSVEVIEPVPEWGLASFDYSDVREFDGKTPSETLNDNVPFFSESDFSREGFVEFSELDELGRCGPAFALVGPETAPVEGEIRPGNGNVKPSGYQFARYSSIPNARLFYRCHLIAWRLIADDGNPLNLITGTYFLNMSGMGSFEEAVDTYVERTGNHVLYRVTPVFLGDELVARGVLVEAASYEDRGASLRYCAWCHNVQLGVEIDYATGESWAADGASEEPAVDWLGYAYVLNTSTKTIHLPDCRHVAGMKSSNSEGSNDSIDELMERGYHRCGNCRP